MRIQYHRHPVVNTPHGFIRRGGQDDTAIFLRLQINLMLRFRLPQSGKTKRPVVRHREPDGRLVRRPLIKPVRRNQAAMMQMMLERRRGNRLRLGVDERLPAPRRFETPLHVHRFNPPCAAPDGRDDLGGGDVVTRADVDDDLDLADQHRDLFLGQAVTRAHLRPNIMLHRLSRQAGMRLVFCLIKFIRGGSPQGPAKTKWIVTHPTRLTLHIQCLGKLLNN